MAHCPSLPAKVSKTQIRVNPLAYRLCGEYSIANNERMGNTSCKDDLMAYALYILILFVYNLLSVPLLLVSTSQDAKKPNKTVYCNDFGMRYPENKK